VGATDNRICLGHGAEHGRSAGEDSLRRGILSRSRAKRYPRSQFLNDRRRATRYRLDLVLEYKAQSRDGGLWIGQGTTHDISNKALRFDGSTQLPAGSTVEVLIRWPIDQEELRPLQLKIEGSVLSSESRGIVVLIGRYLLAPSV
jgi:hypothetical protein